MVAHWTARLSIGLEYVFGEGYDARHAANRYLVQLVPNTHVGNQAQNTQSEEDLGSYLADEVLQMFH